MVDTTFHVSDILTIGGGVSLVATWVGRRVIRAIRSRIHGFDAAIEDHGHRITTLEETVVLHESVLNRLGWHRDRPGSILGPQSRSSSPEGV